ncbi:MAG TPA: helix-turn-helix domain-containing protein [Labilithrix sp.]|nr:helix-turn-helix domain-containing protein [Labilithrix sp.]
MRQQLAVFHRAAPRPRLQPIDRAFWVVLSRTWSRWDETLVVVKPEAVIDWHRRGFVRFWARRSRRAGRPSLDPEIVELIVRMARENPTWSRRRIASELAKLGHAVSKDTSRGTCRDADRACARPRRRGDVRAQSPPEHARH